MNDKTLVERIRNRIHDAPMPTEHLLDEAADRIELLQTILEVTSKEKIDTIEALQSRIEALTAEVERKDAALRAIDRMNDHPKWFRKELNNILESAALQPQEKVG